jgi:membrane associated rhomboid family serine protease
MDTCYRHPDRETAVHCSNCGRPICPDCMTATPVGMRCPDCATNRSVRPAAFARPAVPYVTYMLITANVALYALTSANLLSFSGDLNERGRELALFGPAVQNGDYYRLISSAFLHFGLFHIAFNMYALYWLGTALESYVGSLRFGAIYLISALAGSFGALLWTPNALTAGASGAIFGLMGALLVLERQRGMSLLEGPIGGLLLVNLLFTFAFSGSISVGGHIGGLIGGVLAGLVLSSFGRGHIAYGRITPLTAIGLGSLVVAAIAGSVAIA